MKSITISGSKRESVGKVATKALRNAGKVPCVLYGGKEALHFSADELAFRNLVYTPNVYTATIELESGEKFNAILQDIQFHPVTDKILHIDFYQLFSDKEVTMEIPVHLVGNAPGVMNGGSLRFPKRKLRVKGLPDNLPDFFNADISKLRIGSKLTITEIDDHGCTFLHPENTVVVQVRQSRNASEEEEDEDEEGVEEGAEAAEATAAE
ncbi:50S ribosomal protein L25/general stress protein Ctc [Urechidicola vernalis]|uniref:Large ribosomal subunit protein bL25 n=1 Tax=Urechidicola vernalis TaxID=3075600 RepID=A0ABU2Y6C0_9FLAO|nr:50S ribosomal protein L25/general stress protein Ctc [Urechidicola sp. P050]MDT0553743.1 50S ribosomal protein L25/general stress protein Ctc [Urechidicola sp. P050]